ncbi:MAG TPA: gamma-glutamyl-gamma-aminobutyrate hydrolase family protein [Pyrinomonadaceae bacterium]|nr:gamma-glutamyl-gamma-aminobutyrate hydrolase family protein [Pyrinomonadaceae bacterium]
MTTEKMLSNEQTPLDAPEPLPVPFNQRSFCRYEPIEKRIESARVLVINNLLCDEDDLSDLARKEWGNRIQQHLERERHLSRLACENILNNVERLVQLPFTHVAPLSQTAQAVEEFKPHAIVSSGTLSDFDYYNPEHLESFGRFIRSTKVPVLGICGGHQLIGLSFGAKVVTLENLEQHERRIDRPVEYQYRFIRITEPDDPIFSGVNDPESGLWQDYTTEASILRVWQNHGLQLDRVPEGFRLLATAYRCRNQMMVKRDDGQLIYTVQYHLEKSFQDLNRDRTVRINPNDSSANPKRVLREDASSRTRWSHQDESRDGRIIFENFLRESLKHVGVTGA